MDACVIDWKAITPLIASIIASSTALYISNKWKTQKGKEVLANESKALLLELYELRRQTNFLESNGPKGEAEFLDEITKFNTRKGRIQNSLSFLRDELKNTYSNDFNALETSLDTVNNKLKKYDDGKSYPAFLVLLGSLKGEGKGFWDDVISSVDRVVIILRNVAMYKED